MVLCVPDWVHAVHDGGQSAYTLWSFGKRELAKLLSYKFPIH